MSTRFVRKIGSKHVFPINDINKLDTDFEMLPEWFELDTWNREVKRLDNNLSDAKYREIMNRMNPYEEQVIVKKVPKNKIIEPTPLVEPVFDESTLEEPKFEDEENEAALDLSKLDLYDKETYFGMDRGKVAFIYEQLMGKTAGNKLRHLMVAEIIKSKE